MIRTRELTDQEIELGAAKEEIAQLRETNRRLHRRVQLQEADDAGIRAAANEVYAWADQMRRNAHAMANAKRQAYARHNSYAESLGSVQRFRETDKAKNEAWKEVYLLKKKLEAAERLLEPVEQLERAARDFLAGGPKIVFVEALENLERVKAENERS